MDDLEMHVAAGAALAPKGSPEKAAFTLLLDALRYRQLDPDDLEGLAADLRDGQAPGFGELLFEPRGGERLIVSFLSDRVECQPEPLIAAIDRLGALLAGPEPTTAKP